MSKDKSHELATLWPTVQELTKNLPKSQRKLLSAIFYLAWASTADEEALDRGFNDAFTTEQAALLSEYRSGGAQAHLSLRFTRKSIRSHLSTP